MVAVVEDEKAVFPLDIYDDTLPSDHRRSVGAGRCLTPEGVRHRCSRDSAEHRAVVLQHQQACRLGQEGVHPVEEMPQCELPHADKCCIAFWSFGVLSDCAAAVSFAIWVRLGVAPGFSFASP